MQPSESFIRVLPSYFRCDFEQTEWKWLVTTRDLATLLSFILINNPTPPPVECQDIHVLNAKNKLRTKGKMMP